MLKKLAIFCALLSALALHAVDGALLATLAVNISDQIANVPPHRHLHIPACRQVTYGQKCFLRFAVLNPKVTEGKINIAATLKQIAPDNSEKVIFKDLQVLNTEHTGKGVIISPVSVTMQMEPQDPAGVYRFQLTLTDRNDGNKTFTAKEIDITLKSNTDDLSPMDKKEFDQFFENYYRSPKPERVLAAFECIMKLDAQMRQEKNRKYQPEILLCHLAEVLKISPHLQVPFAKKYGRVKGDFNRVYIAWLVRSCGGEKAMLPHLSPEIQRYLKLLGDRNPLAVTDVDNGLAMDLLWAKFFATGKYEPVKLLINEMRQREMMTPEAAKKKDKLNDKEKQAVMNFALCAAAYWSFGSNLGKGHNLLGFYAENMFMKRTLPDKHAGALLISIFKNLQKKQQQQKKQQK